MADETTAELRALRKEIERFNEHRFVRVQNSWWRLMLYSFSRGLAVGLGTVLGASILVSITVFFLSQIDFIPVIGDWAKQIALELQETVEGARPND